MLPTTSLCFSRLVMLEDNSKPRLFDYWKSPQVLSRSKGGRGFQEREYFLKELSSSLIWGRKSILFFVVFGPCVLRPWFNCPWPQGITQMISSKPWWSWLASILSFSILFLSLGIVGLSESRETWSYEGFLATLIVNAKVIFSLPIVLGLSRFTWDGLPIRYHGDFDRWSKIRFLKRLSITLMGMCALDLLGFAVVCESLYLSNRKLQKQTIKEVLLAE